MAGRCCLIFVAQGLDFCVTVADGLQGVDLIADLEPFVTIQPFELAALLVVQVVEKGAVGFCLGSIGDRLEQFLMGRHGVGVAVVSLLGRRSGIAGNNTGSVITPVRYGQRHLDVTERGGEQLGQFEINGRPLDVA